jgi:hypothetical protein
MMAKTNESTKKSKVALCKKCKNFVKATHVSILDRKIEKEFSDLTNEGYIIQLETMERTKKREWVGYSKKKNGKCTECNNENN